MNDERQSGADKKDSKLLCEREKKRWNEYLLRFR